MQPATERYLALVRQGRNQWWRYLAGVLIVLLFTEILGALPYLWLMRYGDFDGLRVFIALNLGSLIALAGLAIAVVLVHRRSMRSLITPHARIDWRRAAQGFAVWFALDAAASVVESMLFPGRYRLTFNPDTFFMFAAVALCLTPLQAATEELLFRGYVMQGLGLLMKRPAAIAVASGIIFMLPHLANPEVAQNPLLVPPQYLVIGLLLAAVTLRDGRLELALGIHTANNLFSGLIANYDDSVLTTDAIFTSAFDPVYALPTLVVASALAYLILCGRRVKITLGPGDSSGGKLTTRSGEPFSAAELKQFEADGYLVARGLASRDECANIKAVAQRDLDAVKAPVEYEADTRYPGAPMSRDAPGGRTVRRLLQVYARDPAIARWATQPALAARLKQLIGPRIELSQAHHNCVMTKNPSHSSITNWHQDIRYWSFERPELVSVWLALGREYFENGCLLVLPGTHQMEFKPAQLDESLFLRPDVDSNKPLIRTQRRVELEPGDILFFHCRLFHAAGHNQTADTKFSLVFSYHAADNRPLAGTRSASLPEVAL